MANWCTTRNTCRGEIGADLQDALPGITEHEFDAGEVRLNYAEGPPNGPPLVLLHGLGRRWHVFLPIIPALSMRWHIFAPDFRGHGKSARVPRGYHGTAICRRHRPILRERVPALPIIFGHSLGGMIAMWIAVHHPELVRALILGDNMIVAQRIPTPMYVALFSGLRDLARKGGSVEEIAAGIGRIELPRVPSTNESVFIRNLPGNDEAYLLSWARCVVARRSRHLRHGARRIRHSTAGTARRCCAELLARRCCCKAAGNSAG